MEQYTLRSNRWNEAAKYGLLLGLIPTAYLYLGHLQMAIGATGFISSALGFILWAAKFVGCIKLVKYVMIKFASANPSATNSDIFKLGTLMAMLSALVYSVVAVADILYIFPEYYQGVYAAMIEEYSQVLPAASVDEIKEVLLNAPKITFVGTFLYCFLYGTVLSLILSRNIPPQNPFSNYKPDEQ